MYILEKDNVILSKGETLEQLVFSQKVYKIKIEDILEKDQETTVKVTISSNLNYITFKPFVFNYSLYSKYRRQGFKREELLREIASDFIRRLPKDWFTVYQSV